MSVALKAEEKTETLLFRQIRPDPRWDEFVRRQNDLLFYYSAWARTLEEGYRKYQARPLCYVFEKDGEILCGTIGVALDFRFIKIFFDHVPYGGMLGRKELFPKFLQSLERELVKQGVHQLRLTSHFLNRFELNEGYLAKETCQHILDLEGLTPEKLWKSYDSGTRWAVKKAMREKVEVERIRSEAEIDLYYELYQKTMNRNYTAGPFPKDYFRAIYRHLVLEGLADFIFATLQGRPIAAALLMYSRDCVIIYLLVSDEQFFRFRPNELLTHRAILQTLEMKKRYFDFATGYGFNDSLSKFKEKWGARAHSFHTYVKNFSRVRCLLWNGLWSLANTPLGSSIVTKARELRDYRESGRCLRFDPGAFHLEEKPIEDPEWEAFAKRYTAPLFYQPIWGEILERGYPVKARAFALKEGGEIQLGLVASLFDFGWTRLFHANTPYGGFLGALDRIPLFLELLEEKLRNEGVHQIRITQLYGNSHSLPKSYRIQRGCQHVLDLKGGSEETIWQGYKKNIRRDIRRARRSGIVIRPIEDRSEIDPYYEVYQETMKRAGSYGPHSRELYRAIFDLLVPSHQATFLVAEYEGRIIAGVILILSGDTAYLLGNASRSNYLRFCPNDLLIHSAIALACRLGLRYFDFMTTSEQYRGYRELVRFKEKWGTRRYPFIVYEKDLGGPKAFLWRGVWRLANSPWGGFLARRIYKK